MVNKEKIVAEPSSCAVVAALMQYADYDFGENVAVVISASTQMKSFYPTYFNDRYI